MAKNKNKLPETNQEVHARSMISGKMLLTDIGKRKKCTNSS